MNFSIAFGACLVVAILMATTVQANYCPDDPMGLCLHKIQK